MKTRLVKGLSRHISPFHPDLLIFSVDIIKMTRFLLNMTPDSALPSNSTPKRVFTRKFMISTFQMLENCSSRSMGLMISIGEILVLTVFALSFAPFTLGSYCQSGMSQWHIPSVGDPLSVRAFYSWPLATC